MELKNNGLKTTLAIAAVAMITLGSVGAAQAGALASAEISITDLLFTDNVNGNGTGNTLDSDTSFVPGSLNFTAAADISGTFVGPGGGAFGDASIGVAGAPIDLLRGCAGNGCFQGNENDFIPIASPPTGNYAEADQNESGAPILNLPFSPGVDGATVEQGAWAGALDEAIGSADANNSVNATFQFSLANDLSNGVGIIFDAEGYLEAFTNPDATVPTTAAAAYTVDFTLTDVTNGGVQIFSWNPGDSISGGTEVAAAFDLVDTLSVLSPANGSALCAACGPGVEAAGSFAAFTGPLVANNQYTFSARTNVDVDIIKTQVPNVPEPTTLSLLGLCLVGMGVAAGLRRRNNRAV